MTILVTFIAEFGLLIKTIFFSTTNRLRYSIMKIEM